LAVAVMIYSVSDILTGGKAFLHFVRLSMPLAMYTRGQRRRAARAVIEAQPLR